MLTHKVEVLVYAKPKSIWDWMLTMTNEKYRLWHRDHRAYAVLRPSESLLGMRVWFDEFLEGEFRISLSWEIVEVEPLKRVVFKALIPYPVCLELSLAQRSEQTLITHTLTIGKPSWYGRLLDRVINRFIFTERKRMILQRHAQEEMKNLEHLV
jgi:hypothetical protein